MLLITVMHRWGSLRQCLDPGPFANTSTPRPSSKHRLSDPLEPHRANPSPTQLTGPHGRRPPMAPQTRSTVVVMIRKRPRLTREPASWIYPGLHEPGPSVKKEAR
jgi:hypothetical protein